MHPVHDQPAKSKMTGEMRKRIEAAYHARLKRSKARLARMSEMEKAWRVTEALGNELLQRHKNVVLKFSDGKPALVGKESSLSPVLRRRSKPQ